MVAEANFSAVLQPRFLLGWLAFLFCLAGRAQLIHSRYDEPYPASASKKGLQVELVEDALVLGVKHAALNFNLTPLIGLDSDTSNPAWELAGRTYRFHRPQLEDMDRRIKQLSDHDVVVNLIVLAYQSGDPTRDRVMIHPRCVTNAPNRLGQFNTVRPTVVRSHDGILRGTMVAAGQKTRPRLRLHHRQRSQFTLVVGEHGTRDDGGVR